MDLMNLRAVNLVNIALAMAIFPVAAFVVKDYLVYVRASPGVRYDSVLPAPVKPETDIMAYAPIVEGALFPSSTRRFRAVALQDEGPSGKGTSEAFAGISLLGTYMGEDVFAVFRGSGSEGEQVFRPGELVFGAATLLKVLSDAAVISTGSTEVTLKIKYDETPGLSPSVPAPAASSGPGFAAASRKTGEGQWVIDQKAVLNALEDIGGVLTDARLTPVVREGKVQGFRVTEIKPKGIFKALGLNNGDVLGRVNGHEVTSPEKAVQVLTALKGETRIELDLVRGGKPMSFRYEIR